MCEPHYEVQPLRGYVDGAATRAHVEVLIAAGMGWGELAEATGRTVHWLRKNTGRVQAATEARVLAVPVPVKMVPGGQVAAHGTVRRLRALVALGWPAAMLSERLGHSHGWVSRLCVTDQAYVYSRTAVAVDGVYRQLCMTPGPSQQVRRAAERKGWVPPLAWNDIDDAAEVPDRGAGTRVTVMQRYQEVVDLGVPGNRVAEVLGIKPESLTTMLTKHRRKR